MSLHGLFVTSLVPYNKVILCSRIGEFDSLASWFIYRQSWMVWGSRPQDFRMGSWSRRGSWNVITAYPVQEICSKVVIFVDNRKNLNLGGKWL